MLKQESDTFKSCPLPKVGPYSALSLTAYLQVSFTANFCYFETEKRKQVGSFLQLHPLSAVISTDRYPPNIYPVCDFKRRMVFVLPSQYL